MGRLQRSRGTGCAGGNCQSLQVERDHQGFSFNVIEVDVGGVGDARCAFAVYSDRLHLLNDGLFDLLAQPGNSLDLSIFETLFGKLCRLA